MAAGFAFYPYPNFPRLCLRVRTLLRCWYYDVGVLKKFKAAIPVPGRCAWTAQFRPELEGVYDLDVTLLDWRGNLEPHRSQ